MKLLVILLLLLHLIFEFSSCLHLQVISGSSLVLPCPSPQSDSVGSTFTWSFNGKDISEEPSGSVSVKKDGSYLSISPVSLANKGEYTCVVKDGNSEIIKMYNIGVTDLLDITIKVNQGSDVYLPCSLPPSSEVTDNALWFKKTDTGRRQLNLEDDTADAKRITLLYPLDYDQTILIKEAVTEDSGIYYCKTSDETKLSTIHIIVEVLPTKPPFSCDGFPSAWVPCQDENSRTDALILQESVTDFAMKIYSYLRESYPSSNLLISPISISGVLSHLLLGSRDKTRKAIERAVCVPHDFHCVHFQMKKLREKLAGSLQMASQIYYDPHMNLTTSFINQSIQFYEAKPTRLLSNSEDNTQMINSWVANKTQNKITKLVESVSPDTQMILLNAVSFNGEWKTSFDTKPKKGLFTKLDGDMVTVPLLYQRKYKLAMTYVVELKAQVARFPLTGDSSLYILLPRSNAVTDLQQVEGKMTDTAVCQMIEELQTVDPQYVEVTLPQIKLDDQPDMNILMKKLGLSSLFEDPNLCGLNSDHMLVLDDIRHKAFLKLTEKGVEAGAVTAMSFSRSFPSFSALRPFILLLWSDEAKVPLFIGRVTDP